MSTRLKSIKAHGREITVTQFCGEVIDCKGVLKYQVTFGIDKAVIFKNLSKAYLFARLISEADGIL